MNTEAEKHEIWRMIWAKKWLILLVSLLIGVLFLAAAHWLIPPRFEQRLLFYVSVGGEMSGDALNAARDLADSAALLVSSDRVVNALIERSGLPLSARGLRGRLYAEALSGTELLELRVQAHSPEEARQLGAAITELLPETCAEIIPDLSLRLVDGAEAAVEKAFPSELKCTLFGLALGLLLAAAVTVYRETYKHA